MRFFLSMVAAALSSSLVMAQDSETCIGAGGPSAEDAERLREFVKAELIKDNFCPIGAADGVGSAFGPAYCARCGNAEIFIMNNGAQSSGRCFNNGDFDEAYDMLINIGDRCSGPIKGDDYLSLIYGTVDSTEGACDGADLTC